jgi:predicted RNA-binding protein with RPS1 domain
VGDEINVRCTEVNNGKIRLTIKDVDGNGDQFDNIQNQSGPKAEVGGQYEGTVKRVMDYGIFVNFAGTDGLAHHSRIYGVARHEIASTFAEGDDVTITVQEIMPEGKISLSIGEAGDDAEEVKPERSVRKERSARKERDERPARKERKPRKEPEIQDNYDDDDEDLEIMVGKIYLGTVTNLKPYGCFVELNEGVTGLVHLQELADYQFDSIEEVVDIGEEIYVKVIDISRDGKIRLSRKEAVNED